jgi:hypothetical protein
MFRFGQAGDVKYDIVQIVYIVSKQLYDILLSFYLIARKHHQNIHFKEKDDPEFLIVGVRKI